MMCANHQPLIARRYSYLSCQLFKGRQPPDWSPET